MTHLPLEEKGSQYYFSWIILSLQRFGDHAYFPSDESKALKRIGFVNKSHAFFSSLFLVYGCSETRGMKR